MSQPIRKHPESPGDLRPNQLITTFGPGSITQMEHDSVMIMGLDFWEKDEENYDIIYHPHLQKLCNVTHFRMPKSKKENSKIIPCRSFPTWGYCSKKTCRRLQPHKFAPLASIGKKFICIECKNDLLPARLVAMCENGHLDNFPWIEWAHSGKKDVETAKTCDQQKCVLEWNSLNKSTDFGDYYIKCRDCGSSRSMGMAVAKNGIPTELAVCKGYRPWLDSNEKCVKKIKKDSKNENKEKSEKEDLPEKEDTQMSIKGVLTRATSLYFPSVISGLSIPKWRHEVQIRLENEFKEIQRLRDYNLELKAIAEGDIFTDLREKYPVTEIVEQMQKRFDFISKPEDDKPTTLEIKNEEYDDLTNTKFPGDDEIKITEENLTDALKDAGIASLKKIDRLTLIKVLRYFTRGDAPNPHAAEKDSDEISKCFLSRRKASALGWYPCVRHRGEGIFFSFDEEKLKAWESLPEVEDRCNAIMSGYLDWIKSRKWNIHDSIKSPSRYILLHSISHVLIRELSFLSGYSEASIAERIYVGDNHNAILLYTSSPSSDGSLGGLVRQGSSGRFYELLESAIKRAKHCSRDPLCIEEDPIEKKDTHPPHARLNGSACYACSLLPETSCEESNRLLDRKLLFDEKIGFFSNWR
jgi:hypothetical protein